MKALPCRWAKAFRGRILSKKRYIFFLFDKLTKKTYFPSLKPAVDRRRNCWAGTSYKQMLSIYMNNFFLLKSNQIKQREVDDELKFAQILLMTSEVCKKKIFSIIFLWTKLFFVLDQIITIWTKWQSLKWLNMLVNWQMI